MSYLPRRIVSTLAISYKRPGREETHSVVQISGKGADNIPSYQYCVGCHTSKVKSGGLSLDTLNVENPGEHADTWEKVVRKLGGRMMPPPGRPRPDEGAYDMLVSYLENSLDRAAAANPNPGRTNTFRRLNRIEYQNAIRDLLALDVDVASMLPKDDASFGFDNIGVKALSPTLLERYLSAAQKISRLAIGTSARTAGASTRTYPQVGVPEAHHPVSHPFA